MVEVHSNIDVEMSILDHMTRSSPAAIVQTRSSHHGLGIPAMNAYM